MNSFSKHKCEILVSYRVRTILIKIFNNKKTVSNNFKTIKIFPKLILFHLVELGSSTMNVAHKF